MAKSLKYANPKHFIAGGVLAFGVSTIFLLSQNISLKKAFFGFFYFLVTPFLALPHFPIGLIIIGILFLLFRRVSSCMRPHLRWIAYGLLWLHWVAFGFYCSSFVVNFY